MSKVQYIMKASIDEMIDLRDFLLSVEGHIVEGVDHFAALRPMFEQFVGRDPESKLWYKNTQQNVNGSADQPDWYIELGESLKSSGD